MLTIVKGDDRFINLFITNKSKRPYDLTGWTKVSVYFRKQFDSFLEKTTDAYSTAAFATYNGVTFTAQTLGTTGNSVSLVFNGISSVASVVSAWNTANPFNKVSHDSANVSTVLPSGTVNLQYGQDNLIDVTVVNAILGHIKVRLHDMDTVLLLAGKALSFKAIIDKGAPPLGERRKVIFTNSLEVVDDGV